MPHLPQILTLYIFTGDGITAVSLMSHDLLNPPLFHDNSNCILILRPAHSHTSSPTGTMTLCPSTSPACQICWMHHGCGSRRAISSTQTQCTPTCCEYTATVLYSLGLKGTLQAPLCRAGVEQWTLPSSPPIPNPSKQCACVSRRNAAGQHIT